MIVKIDAATEARLSELEKIVAQHTGLQPQNTSLMVQVILNWAIKRIKGPTMRSLAPQMLSLSQRRKAVINEMAAHQDQMSGDEIKTIMKTLGKLKRKTEKSDANLINQQT